MLRSHFPSYYLLILFFLGVFIYLFSCCLIDWFRRLAFLWKLKGIYFADRV